MFSVYERFEKTQLLFWHNKRSWLIRTNQISMRAWHKKVTGFSILDSFLMNIVKSLNTKRLETESVMDLDCLFSS